MKYFIIFGILGSMFFNIQKTNAQIKDFKKNEFYYFLDTANVPIKDRMIVIDKEMSFITYAILCKCYPWGTDVAFYYNYKKATNIKVISIEEFKKIKTIALPKLIEIAVKYGKDGINNNIFYFIEPCGNKMKVTEVIPMPPRNPRLTTTYEIIKP